MKLSQEFGLCALVAFLAGMTLMGYDCEPDNCVVGDTRCSLNMVACRAPLALRLKMLVRIAGMKPIKVFLDDLRSTPPGWQRAYTAWEAITFCQEGRVTELSLDYDLNDAPRRAGYCENADPGTGGDVMEWLVEQARRNNWDWVPPVIRLHSVNAEGLAHMAVLLAEIERRRFVANGTPPLPPGLW